MTQAEKLQPIIKPIHINTLDFVIEIDGQNIMRVGTLQCPKHWHMLGSLRCPEHEYCAITDVCSACVKEENND